MKVPLSWLSDYVDIKVSPRELASALTMSGSKVEGMEETGADIQNVVVGRIVSLDRIPDADRLRVSRVDVGNGIIQVVTGAQNVNTGDFIPVALDGAMLPGGRKISRGMIRGVESNGMMCSIQELNITKDDYPEASENGIFILDGELTPGKDIKEVLGLNDTVAEFEITPNRPDCLSIIGMAREVSATLKSRFKKPRIRVREDGDDAVKFASVQVVDSDLCPRYAARIVKDVRIGTSPAWMRRRLRSAGIRPINNIVDITNYVMLEMGQPMHAFDLEMLNGKKIIVRRALDGETIRTLDGQEKCLDISMLVIADAKRPVAVAGVMGGENSEVTAGTGTILFESANFDRTSVRLTARKLGTRTEASGRFEKGLDAGNVVSALDRAAELVEELGIGTVCRGVLDCCEKKFEERSIRLRPGKINRLLGTSLSAEEMIDILKALELEYDEKNSAFKIPGFRNDIEGEADLAEEIARFYGYNNIQASLLEGKASTRGGKTTRQKSVDIIKNTMTACGLSEIYTYSFTSPKVFDRINVPHDSELRRTVEISNPLGEDYSIMRTTTIPDMLDVIVRNFNRKVQEARFFELSHIYLPGNRPEELPDEHLVLTMGMYGNVGFYDLKGICEELFDILGITDYAFVPEEKSQVFHPHRTADIMVSGKTIGIIGEVHPDVIVNYNGPERTYIGFIDWDGITPEILDKNSAGSIQYKPLPRYPAVERDIALLVSDDVMAGQVVKVIGNASEKLLESIRLFDVYRGSQVPEGMKSMAYSITFRAEDRTLTDEEVNSAMGRILDALKKEFNAKLRQ